MKYRMTQNGNGFFCEFLSDRWRKIPDLSSPKTIYDFATEDAAEANMRLYHETLFKFNPKVIKEYDL